jgi:hypothetical protein
MKNFDLQIIWSAQSPFVIPGFLALHVHLEAERAAIPTNVLLEKWFYNLDEKEKAHMAFVHLN